MDFRSDTVTKPTDKMRESMLHCAVGDDVYGDDPTVNELEALAASMLGKEAALFVPSGTFSNQCAIMTHTRRGDEIIGLEDAHIVMHEVGAAAVLSQVSIRQARSHRGEYDLKELEALIREDDIHYPRTSLICHETAHSNGRAIPLENLKGVYELAKKYDLNVHIDGARIFNGAVALGVDVKEISKYADSVSVCLSKGLCAPVGSVLVGTKEFIDRARKNRKLMGGGLRQAGILAAPGIIALKEMTGRLDEDHENAKYLAERLKEFDGFEVLEDRLDINMVFFRFSGIDLVEPLLERGILINGIEAGEYRFVTNNGIDRTDIDRLIIALKEILS
ncbi:low-specificity L-threonine aldolase [Guggenheimella bovis]